MKFDLYIVYSQGSALSTLWPGAPFRSPASGNGWDTIARDAVKAGRINYTGRYVIQNVNGHGLAIVDVTITVPTEPTITVEVVS